MILEINAYQETELYIRVREHAGSVLKPDGSGRKVLSNNKLGTGHDWPSVQWLGFVEIDDQLRILITSSIVTESESNMFRDVLTSQLMI